MELDDLRKKINNVDDAILELLSERREIARRIIELKQQTSLPLRDSQREEDLLAQLIARGRKLGLDAHLVTRVFHEIIDDSVRLQQLGLLKGLNREEKKSGLVAFQGIEGAYSHLAAKKFFASMLDDLRFAGYPTFRDVVEVVEEGVADFGMLPVENTTAGNINDVYDLLSVTPLSIVGEEIFRVEHCLLGIEELPVSRIRRVLSHPQALTQCARYLDQLSDCQAEYYPDTAMAVRKVKEDGDPLQAAIASEEAGRLYGLKVLARNLADQTENFTRFLIAARKPIRVDSRIPSKTSLIVATGHHPGALNRALDVLTRHDINMTKLDARPKPGSPFEYLFYIDIEGHVDEERVRKALHGLRGVSTHLKILGSYPMENRGRTPPSIQALLAETPESAPRPRGAETRPTPAASSADASYSLVSRDTRSDDTVIRVRNVEIGGGDFVVIAGPCSVESEEQLRQCAHEVKERGGRLLRGGCFRSRTSPWAFAGLGMEGLQLLSRVGREYDLPIVTEVVSVEDVASVAQIADVLLIGARNMQAFDLLREVGKVNRPVILKRGMMASIDEFLAAADYVLEQGNHQVILCERGIRTFDTAVRNTLDLGAIPLLKQLTHLPIIVDPSHAAGRSELVLPLALAARAVGPHGMMVEVHPNPEEALSDGHQALRFEDFTRLMREIYRS